MARCWTCGSNLAGGLLGHFFTCPLCEGSKELKRIREKIESTGPGDISVITLDTSGISEGLVGIASIIEWGFEELSWKIDQMTEVLQSIDRTLKAPSRTRAEEWRRMAEELRRRGILNDSEKFFWKSLTANPLDYRIYIGLGKTYIQMGKSDKARTIWGRSLPHAPKGEIDYRSYSYRLIGRAYFCEGDFQKAAQTLKTAIELSPNYYLAQYDYAQYCALVGEKRECIASLRTVISGSAFYFSLARKEKNFNYLGSDVTSFLMALRQNAIKSTNPVLLDAERELAEAKKETSMAREMFSGLGKIYQGIVMPDMSSDQYKEAETLLGQAKNKVLSEDLESIFEAKKFAAESTKIAKNAKLQAEKERQDYTIAYRVRDKGISDSFGGPFWGFTIGVGFWVGIGFSIALQSPIGMVYALVGSAIIGSILGFINQSQTRRRLKLK